MSTPRITPTSRVPRFRLAKTGLTIITLLITTAGLHAQDTCETPPPPSTSCTGVCSGLAEQCVPLEILADSSGKFIAITCCDCQEPACHVDVDANTLEILCAKDCPIPPGFPCELISKGNLDGTITYTCECRDPSLPAICEPTSDCNPCVPGSCVQRCPGPCPEPTELCVPTLISENPPNSGNYTILDCDCDPECHPVVTTDGVECVDQCPDGVTPCPEPVVIDNPQGGVDYTCPPCPGVETCPEPTGQNICADRQDTDCVSDDPSLNCLPTCINVDGMGQVTALTCTCSGSEECHVVATGAAEPFCEGDCPPGQLCVKTVSDDGSGGTDICCSCESECGPSGCCAGRPQLEDAFFAGRVAVVTASPNVFGGFVVTVLDLDKAVVDVAPLNADFPIGRYSHPSWTPPTLGSVFGITLDPAGNMYVTASTSYQSDVQGICTGWGGVYRLDGVTGAVTCFADLFNTGPVGPGLGNIAYDCQHNQFFVTNFDDGMIYRLDTNGIVLSTYDHGVPNDPNDFYSPLGDRLWGVEVHRGRVYYSVWNQDFGRDPGAGPNEIWSVGLDPNGDFALGASLEITLPPLPGSSYSNPVSDIRFTPKEGRMLLAERGMISDSDPAAHQARVLEYVCVGADWFLSSNTFGVGVSFSQQNAAGGVDVDFKPAGRVWATGDGLQFNPATMYGIQGLPATGGDVFNSVLIDYNGNVIDQDKTEIGDVVVNCPACATAPDQMVAWWPFDEITGPIALDITGDNHGAHTNGPTPTPAGRVAGALSFNGIDEYVEVPHDSTIDFGTGSFSIDAWIHFNGFGGSGGTLARKKTPGLGGVGYEFLVTGSGFLVLTLESGLGISTISTSPVAIGDWTHVAVTVDRTLSGDTSRSFYIDGQPAGGGGPNVFGTFSNSDPLWIGRGSAGFFPGIIDEMEMFDRALTQNEIRDIFQAGSNGKCKPCRPASDLLECEPFDCPGQFDVCQVIAVVYDSNTGEYAVLKCRCGTAVLWHLEFDDAGVPLCAGVCPPGHSCSSTIVEHPDGSMEVSCDVEDVGGCLCDTDCDDGNVCTSDACLPDGTCLNEEYSPLRGDLVGTGGSCKPDGQVDLSDILYVLDQFQGIDRCCDADASESPARGGQRR